MGYENARLAGLLWFGEDDLRNKVLKLDPGPCSIVKGVRDTLAVLLTQTPPSTPLLIKTDMRSTIISLTIGLEKNEDLDWKDSPDRSSMKDIVAMLRARCSETSFTIIGNNSDPQVLNGIRSKLKHALSNANGDVVAAVEVPQKYQISGMQISQATQAIVYRRIVNMRREPARPATMVNLDIARQAAGHHNGLTPLDARVWLSIRDKSVTPRARSFLWKAMHNAYKLGRFWAHIPNYEQRQFCHACGNADETLEHILTRCRASQQETIWNAARELWALRELPWPPPTMGVILGSGLHLFHTQAGKMPLPGANRLYKIIMSESAHMIWKIRCQWRIQDEGDLDKILSNEGARGKWLDQINRRLQLECLQTNPYKYGKMAVRKALVEKTWWAVLKNREDLPDDWIENTGVLVGIGRRPPGRNR
ncbi:hypothetical protein BJ912DRAFT_846780 [Pholiota molesta]|nr:hypothetical protein BJ912DRAFT_846780 [Pholiota molesta]